LDFGLFNHGSRGSFGRDFAQKIVAVEVFPLDGKEQIARLRLPRIGADIFDQRFRRAAPEFGAAGFGDKFQRASFHKLLISAKTWP
jgi:hypothetical protein